MNYLKDKLWQIEELGFDSKYLGKTESIMALGNGYLGTRSAAEEHYTNERRNTFVAGTFNKFDENEVSELPNIPDLWWMDFIINGENFTLEKGKVSNYSKRLNLRTGELTREFEWTFETIKLQFTFRRFVSKARRHYLSSLVEIKNLAEQSARIQIRSGIDGQVTNSGSQHFTEGEKGLIDGRFMQMMPRTKDSKIDFVFTVAHDIKAANVSERIEMGRRQIFMNYFFDLPSKESALIEKRMSVYTSIDNDLSNHQAAAIRQTAISEMKEIEMHSFDDLLNESSRKWEEIWNKHPIKIESENFKDQLAIHFAKYHLHIMTPAHDNRMNIGAKGLSGEGYKGHTFWDTEIFMLPYFNFTHSDIAKSLVTYRYLGLDGAHKKAKANGYEGAQYPWEAANPTDGEVTPVWGAADIVTGQSTKIWSGFIEQHITSDVTFGVKQYIDVTGDKEFAEEKAYEILFDTAKFWGSRLEYNTEKDCYEIRDVIGPDEYKEHVNNNAYTNYTAHWNVTYALNLAEELKENQPVLFEKLNQKLELERVLSDLEQKVDKIFLPQPTEEGIIPEDDSYLEKEVIDLSNYKAVDGVDGLFHDYNLEQVNEMQITKQADVLLLLYLFEGLFSHELKLKNFDYYEPKTTHDSSLSLSTHAILAADLGKLDESYEFFKKACNIDMGEYMKSSDDGIHAGSLGGIWQMIVFGYGGVRMIEGQLRIEPHLPNAWKELTYGFDYQGQSITVKVTSDGFELTKEANGADITFISKGKNYTLKDRLQLS
ncbi:glycoside hydrolase family 65 protein [Enterococcus sp. BWB1-3]|uniref:glycoside hydrolase family 65 protein n=1 Tax=unclassified Enterococcus TaxID=2608891 RepID=UPI0019221944|nr:MULTISPECIES: glycoside hydrolase family 65 protein [unclassified Enterococcus]MBL1229767.1 glycoside hydrolase family 65 protein [Enterococcus sp. BWB1-3]MCB5956265.1 glycoside hydrolase family 65 protein [Enterococcus sp. CWB-B31]